MSSRTGKFAVRLLLIWAAWTAYAVFSASQNYLTRAYTAKVEWKPALEYALLDSYVWAALTPVVLWLAGRLLVRRANWWRAMPPLVLASIVIAVVHLNVFARLLPFIGYQNSFRARQLVFTAKFHSALLTCWVLFGIRHGIEYYRDARIRAVISSQLAARLAVAQLEVLKMQLQPHFLFNTLHAISALMYRNPEGADRMIARLSDFLRLTLDSAGVQEVTLKREMEYLDKYLEIEQVRFGDRLEVRRAIEPVALDLLLPNLVLQPLVENAVRHGIAPRATGGRIEELRVDAMPVVIFVTAFDQYAIKAFEVCALDYLLKPFDRDRFSKALARGKVEFERRSAGDLSARLRSVLDEWKGRKPCLDRLVIRSGGRVFFLRVDELDWVEAAGNYVRLHTGREEYLYRETMSRLEASLDPEKFARIHRSVMVNVERVKELHPLFRGDFTVVLRDGRKLTLSKAYRDRLRV